MSSEAAKHAAMPKHRACDECRARKLACSKEPGGCDRCRRESLLCHYSPQKPMGRPRKRRHIRHSPPGAVSIPPGGAVASGIAASQHSGGFGLQPGLLTHADFDFLGSDAALDPAFLDLLPSTFYQGNGDSLDTAQAYCQDVQLFGGSALPMQCAGTHLAAGFELGWPDLSATTAMGADGAPRSASSDMSSAVASPVSSPGGTVKASPSMPCGCLSSLCLALESLSHLPLDLASAMRIARGACKVAQDVIECRDCSGDLVRNPSEQQSMQWFQNLMLLGTLVPSACNAYAAILEMVDRETAAAKREARGLFFSSEDMGGLWGSAVGSCSAIASLNNRFLEPDVWRKTIRAILRLDVYGLGDAPSTPPAAPRHKGLRDVLAHLDQTSRKRHEIMDHLVANGYMPKHPFSQYLMFPTSQAPFPSAQRTCVGIMETAKAALDKLAIA